MPAFFFYEGLTAQTRSKPLIGYWVKWAAVADLIKEPFSDLSLCFRHERCIASLSHLAEVNMNQVAQTFCRKVPSQTTDADTCGNI